MLKDFKIIPITESEYNEWIIASKNTYMLLNIKNGKTKEEAEKKANDDYHQLLPNGLLTEHSFIYSIKANDQWVGTLWFGIRGPEDNRKAFIYDIVIDEVERVKVYGEEALKFLEGEVKKLGYNHIGLHVFGHNKVARRLYEKMGYEVMNLFLEKKI
jgi:ribosomal protein S18 acetylase RimI-like enzyme